MNKQENVVCRFVVASTIEKYISHQKIIISPSHPIYVSITLCYSKNLSLYKNKGLSWYEPACRFQIINYFHFIPYAF